MGNFLFLTLMVGRRHECLMNRQPLADSVYDNKPTRRPPILLKTLLNKVRRIKSFVYHSVSLSGTGDSMRIIAKVIPRTNSKPRCSGCGKHRPGYDRISLPREFEFIPIWNIPVALSYTMRRVDCPACGIKVEAVPWAQGKHASRDVFRHFLASWARRMSWKETATCFRTNARAMRSKVNVPKSTPYQSTANRASSPGCPNHALLDPAASPAPTSASSKSISRANSGPASSSSSAKASRSCSKTSPPSRWPPSSSPLSANISPRKEAARAEPHQRRSQGLPRA